jgi:hypothetical protein
LSTSIRIVSPALPEQNYTMNVDEFVHTQAVLLDYFLEQGAVEFAWMDRH